MQPLTCVPRVPGLAVSNEMWGIGHLVGKGSVAFCGYAVTSGLHATAYCAGVYCRFVAQSELGLCQRQHLQRCL